MIYKQLLKFIKIGQMPIIFDAMSDEPMSAVFYCTHDLDEMLEHDELRAGCCDTRIDLLIIAEHLYNILRRCCQQKLICADHILMRLPPYDHYAGFVPGA